MKTNKILATLLLSVFFLNGYSQEYQQEVQKIISPSPQAAAFTKYGEMPVSTYTGTPNIDIPIYTIRSGDIQVPISLSYHASGIRVDEEASWVGLGWNLNAGGVISRTVRNRDDFYLDSYFNTQVPEIMNVSPSKYMIEDCVMSTEDGSQTIDLSEYIDDNVNDFTYGCDPDHAHDFEPDQYSYNFSGYSGKFILKRNREEVLAKLEKIDFEVNSVGTLWTVITQDGFEYTFDKYEQYNDGDAPNGCIPQNVKTAWYLTKIESPKGSVVTFGYDVENNVYNKKVSSPSFVVNYYNTVYCPNGGISGQVSKSLNQYQRYTNVTLSNICFENGEIIFDYNSDRVDLDGGKKLNKIQFFKGVEQTPWKELEFNYDYFQGSGDAENLSGGGYYSDNQLYKRLKLESIQEKAGSDEKPPYTFEYFEGVVGGTLYRMPAKTSFARDHWGYFNGVVQNNTLIPEYIGLVYMPYPFYRQIAGADRSSSERHMKTYALREINYPTGGSTEFKFEAHDFAIEEEDTEVFDIEQVDIQEKFQQIPAFTDDGWSDSYEVDLTRLYVPDPDNSDAGRVDFSLTFIGSSGPVSNGGAPLNLGDVFVDIFKENEDGSFSQTSVIELVSSNLDCPQGNLSLSTAPGVCSYEMFYNVKPGKLRFRMYVKPSIVNLFAISASFSWNEPVILDLENPTVKAGGLRVSEIKDRDENGDLANARKFVYNYQADENGDGITETRSYGRRMVKPHYLYYTLDTYSWIVPGAEHIPSPISYCINYSMSSNSVSPLNGSASGSAVGYDRVEVLQGLDESTGQYGKIGKTVYEYENHSDQNINYGLFEVPGIPQIGSNRNGLLLKQFDYKYTFNSTDPYEIVKKTINEYEDSDTNMTVYGMKRHVPTINATILDWASSCDVKLFLYPALQTDWIRLVSTTATTYSQNGSPMTSTKYNFYENQSHLQLTRSLQFTSNDQEIENLFYYPDDYSSSAGGNIGALQSAGIVVPIKSLTTIDGNVVSGSVNKYNTLGQPTDMYSYESKSIKPALAHNSGVLLPPDYEIKVQLDYDTNNDNNPTEILSKDGIYTSYIWGYNDQYPVAKIENAPYGSIPIGIITEIKAMSVEDDDHCLDDDLNCNEKNLRTSLNALRSAAALSNALITTYTYDPLIGITSETGVDGRTIYYEYDDFGRLRLVRDHDGNILKKNQYYYNQN